MRWGRIRRGFEALRFWARKRMSISATYAQQVDLVNEELHCALCAQQILSLISPEVGCAGRATRQGIRRSRTCTRILVRSAAARAAHVCLKISPLCMGPVMKALVPELNHTHTSSLKFALAVRNFLQMSRQVVHFVTRACFVKEVSVCTVHRELVILMQPWKTLRFALRVLREVLPRKLNIFTKRSNPIIFRN
jgi:hypothetical protein